MESQRLVWGRCVRTAPAMHRQEADSVWARADRLPNWADWEEIPRIPWNLFWETDTMGSTEWRPSPPSLDEIVARAAEAAGIARPGEALAGKVRVQLRELYGANLVGVR